MSSVVGVPSTTVARVLLKWKTLSTPHVMVTVVILASTILARLYDTGALRPTFRPSKSTSRDTTSAETVTPLFLDKQGLLCI